MSARILFVGSKRIGARCLERAGGVAEIAGVVTLDDRADARSVYAEIEERAHVARTPFDVVGTSKELAAVIERVKPDLVLVVGWYRIIPAALLDAAPLGFVGIHGSLLPKYRGGSPLVWALINGERETGVTMFQFAPGMDDGDVWAQRRIAIGDDDTIADVLARAEDAAVEMVGASLGDVVSGRARATPQDHGAATYCAQREPRDGEIDWRKPARAVHDFVRAQSDPYPGAFTAHEGARIVVQRTSVPEVTFYGTAGQVVRRDGDAVWVSCGDDRVVAVSALGSGPEVRPASDVIRSLSARLGG